MEAVPGSLLNNEAGSEFAGFSVGFVSKVVIVAVIFKGIDLQLQFFSSEVKALLMSCNPVLNPSTSCFMTLPIFFTLLVTQRTPLISVSKIPSNRQTYHRK